MALPRTPKPPESGRQSKPALQRIEEANEQIRALVETIADALEELRDDGK
jgi:hypothetical protein